MAHKNKLISCILTMGLLLPVTASAISLEEAARQASRNNNNAKILSAKTVKKGSGSQHEIKLLTKKGVVKTVRVPNSSKKKR